MLDAVHPWGMPVRRSLGAAVSASVALERWQRDAYFALRRAIFCDEQRLFAETDRDALDAEAVPIVAMTEIGGMPDRVVGVVRIYETEPGAWFGGRLGVHRDCRRHGAVGTVLIQAAVGIARAAGALRFHATVQGANVRYFERHAFERRGALTVCGAPHELMEARLASFEPRDAALHTLLSRVA